MYNIHIMNDLMSRMRDDVTDRVHFYLRSKRAAFYSISCRHDTHYTLYKRRIMYVTCSHKKSLEIRT